MCVQVSVFGVSVLKEVPEWLSWTVTWCRPSLMWFRPSCSFNQPKTKRENGSLEKGCSVHSPLMVRCSTSPELQQLDQSAAENRPLRLKRARSSSFCSHNRAVCWRAGQRPRPHYVHNVQRLKGFGGHLSMRTGVGDENKTLSKAQDSLKFTMVDGESKVWEQSEQSIAHGDGLF